MSKTVLVVDDSAAIRQVVKIALREAGHEVVEADNGKNALSKMQGKRFNLVISDVNMPEMNGIELVKAIKQDPNNKFTPIMMLTTESQAQKKEEGKQAGAKAWLVKPFNKDILLNAVSRLI